MFVKKTMTKAERAVWLKWVKQIRGQGGSISGRRFLKNEADYWSSHGWHGVAPITVWAMGKSFKMLLAWGPSNDVAIMHRSKGNHSYRRFASSEGTAIPALLDLVMPPEQGTL